MTAFSVGALGPSGEDVAWSPALGLFVAVGAGGIAYSGDGVNWTLTAFGWGSGGKGLGVCWSPDLALFVAVGQGDDQIATSSDGVTWTGLGQFWGATVFTKGAGVCWSPDLSLFVAVGFTTVHGDDSVFTSADGSSWTGAGAVMDPVGSGGAQIRGVCWTGTKFIAVGNSQDTVAGTFSNCIATSPDGVAWTNRGNPLHVHGGSIEAALSVAWSAPLGLVVLAAGVGEGNLWTSPDGAAWTYRGAHWPGSGNSTGAAVCWSEELALFVAVGFNAGSHVSGDPPAPTRIVVSPDGVNWTDIGTPFGNTNGTIDGVCWSPDLGVFCATGDTDDGPESGIWPVGPFTATVNCAFAIN